MLQYQNQKLVQQVEAQKAECFALENKFNQLKEKQQNYDDTLIVVNKCWGQVCFLLQILSPSFQSVSILCLGLWKLKWVKWVRCLQLVDELESLSICTRGSVNGVCDANHSEHLEGKICRLIHES